MSFEQVFVLETAALRLCLRHRQSRMISLREKAESDWACKLFLHCFS